MIRLTIPALLLALVAAPSEVAGARDDEISALEQRVAALEARLASVEARDRRAAAPNDEAMERVMLLSERMMRRFFDLVREMKQGEEGEL